MLDNDSKIVDAILGDDEKALKALLANPMVNPNGMYCDASYLCLAIMNKKMWAVEQFCDHILVDLNTRSKALGQTPLQYAILHDTDIALYLLKRQANPNVTDRNGDTALHTVTKAKSANLLAFDDLIETLLKDKRLNVMAKNDDGIMAYELASYYMQPLLAENLRIKLWLKSNPELAPKKEAKQPNIHDAVKYERLDIAEDLIKKTGDKKWNKADGNLGNILTRVTTETIKESGVGSLSDAFGKAASDPYVTNDFDKETYYNNEDDLYKNPKRPGTVKRP